VLCGFDGAASRMAGRKGIVTGAPVREQIAALARPEQRLANRSGPLRLLVAGGSLGARILNETIPPALALMPADRRPHVLHQCGAPTSSRPAPRTRRRACRPPCWASSKTSPAATRRPTWWYAGPAPSRCPNCARRAVAAILVPLVVSTTDHQRFNAEFLASRGAALHLPQPRLDAPTLASLLGSLTREQILAIAVRARSLGHPDATAAVAAAIESLVQGRTGTTRHG